MNAQQSSIGLDAFRRGETWPLSIPESLRYEFTTNPCLQDQWREWEAENGQSFGYQFPWGQIHEDPTRPVSGGDSDGIAMEWHFVLSELQAAFRQAGGDLGELSDWCIAVLEQADGYAQRTYVRSSYLRTCPSARFAQSRDYLDQPIERKALLH